MIPHQIKNLFVREGYFVTELFTDDSDSVNGLIIQKGTLNPIIRRFRRPREVKLCELYGLRMEGGAVIVDQYLPDRYSGIVPYPALSVYFENPKNPPYPVDMTHLKKALQDFPLQKKESIGEYLKRRGPRFWDESF